MIRKTDEFTPRTNARGGVGTIYLKKKRLGNLLDNTGLDFLGLADGARMALYDVPDCKKVLRLIKGR